MYSLLDIVKKYVLKLVTEMIIYANLYVVKLCFMSNTEEWALFYD